MQEIFGETEINKLRKETHGLNQRVKYGLTSCQVRVMVECKPYSSTILAMTECGTTLVEYYKITLKKQLAWNAKLLWSRRAILATVLEHTPFLKILMSCQFDVL